MMKSLTASVIALLLMSVSGAVLAAREKVDETKNAAANGFVKVIVVRGHVKVEGWDRNEIHVSGLLDEQTRKFIFDVDQDETLIEVRLPNHLGGGWWHSDEGADLVIQVPAGSRVDTSVVSADTRATGILGGLKVRAVSGDVTVDKAKQRLDLTSVSGDVYLRHSSGRISVKSVSGDISIDDCNGSFKLHSVSGDVVARNVSDDFDLQSISGDIETEDASYKAVNGNTVSGDLSIGGQMQDGGSVDLDSVSGSIRLTFKGDVDAHFDLDAGSGSIRNRVSGDKPATSKYDNNETLRFTKGSGKGQVTLSTRSGDIILSH